MVLPNPGRRSWTKTSREKVAPGHRTPKTSICPKSTRLRREPLQTLIQVALGVRPVPYFPFHERQLCLQLHPTPLIFDILIATLMTFNLLSDVLYG
ncbi:hypothetical protein BDZ94DRAFT_578352 [Collybia nuda]|uniref:Uncharacterized protein n=1 Tax=Collybia nuda TaxID=64659 RepID=A0A9P6CFB5_9AGAR|nr:hypothetical protein BDZ94DRAFT_578352 [Collybia nuda]